MYWTNTMELGRASEHLSEMWSARSKDAQPEGNSRDDREERIQIMKKLLLMLTLVGCGSDDASSSLPPCDFYGCNNALCDATGKNCLCHGNACDQYPACGDLDCTPTECDEYHVCSCALASQTVECEVK